MLRRLLPPRGTLVLVGSETAGAGSAAWTARCGRCWSPGSSASSCALVSPENTADLVESGQVVPAVERTFGLHETAAAIGHMVDGHGHVRGKVVVTI